MYQGYALVICLILNFFSFANQTLSIARNNPPDGEQIEQNFGRHEEDNEDTVEPIELLHNFLALSPTCPSPGVTGGSI